MIKIQVKTLNLLIAPFTVYLNISFIQLLSYFYCPTFTMDTIAHIL